MMRCLVAMCWFIPLGGWAVPLPPDLAVLSARIDAADARLGDIRAQIERLEAKAKTQAARYQASTRAMAQLAQNPPPLLLAYAVLANTPSAPGLLAASQRLTLRNLETDGLRLHAAGRLWEEAHAQLADLRALNDQMTTGRKSLARMEQRALRHAAIVADDLGKNVETALVAVPPVSSTQPAPVAALPASAAPLLPVVGRVVRGFDPPGSFGMTFEGKPAGRVVNLRGGTVMYSGPFRNKGGLIIVGDHAMQVIYAGFDTLAVKEGDAVEPGRFLGALETRPRPRLYVEVRRRGAPVDPDKALE